MTFFGLKISASRLRRSSGTLTTPTLSWSPPKPPVSACPRVSVLNTVVLPDPASPTIAICIGRSYRPLSFLGPGTANPSVPGGRVDDVQERLTGRVAPEVVAEQLDAPVED